MKTVRILIVAAAACSIAFRGAFIATAAECLRPPLPEALDALHSTVSVDVSTVTVASWDNSTPAPADDNIYYVFKPKRDVPKTGFIILPGGNCDPRSYAPAAHEIAKNGFSTFIIPMPSCVAIYGIKRSGKVIQDHADIETWVLGGHSVGGTAASMYAANAGQGTVSGVVIWASLANPDPAKTLANSSKKALSVYGSEDGRATPESVLENAEYLPADTLFVEIEGGNHTQFGYIDPAPDAYLSDDNPATITLEEQQGEMVGATVDFLKQFDNHACPVASLFGRADLRTKTIARFRDEILTGSAAGRSIIACYEKNGAEAVEILDKYPTLKSAAGKVLGACIPLIKVALCSNRVFQKIAGNETGGKYETFFHSD